MAPISPNNHQRRILQLSQEWGVVLPPGPSRLERPQQPPSFRTSSDDHAAEALLQRRAAEISQVKPKGGLSRAFSTNNLKKGKNWDPAHILEVLTSWVSQSGSPGVAEALIAKLSASGVDLGLVGKQKSSILSRRKSLDGVDRTKLLRLAVQSNQYETVQVLCPLADPLALDTCLPLAIKTGNTPIAELLLRYGASLSQTAEGQDAFRQACSIPALSEMIKFILQSDGRPCSSLASQCMVDAVRAGSLITVLHLSRSVADGDFNQAEALQHAVKMGRKDIALAIIMGNKPPQLQGINQSFEILIDNPSLNAATKLQFAELLLCAGAQGEVVAQSLQGACDSQFYQMAGMLASYGVSIEYDNASVVKTAICRGQIDLVRSLLSPSAKLSPDLASSCVEIIPTHFREEDRYLLLYILLKKGAKGEPLDQMLVVAAKAGEIKTVELLLKPFFPNSRSQVQNSSQPQERHEVASPDYKDGEALRTAVLRMDKSMVEIILAAKPSPETILKIFSLTRNLPVTDRHEMVKVFLKGSTPGPGRHAALQDAISEADEIRDTALIEILLAHDADINYNYGAGLQAVIMRKDIDLLESLLQKASPQTAAARVPDAMMVQDTQARYAIVSCLLKVGAGIGAVEVAFALMDTLQEKTVDMKLLELLLKQGNADVNLPNVPVVNKAITVSESKVLDLILGIGKPSADTITNAIQEISTLPSTDGKTLKLKTALGLSKRHEDLSALLVTEVQSSLKTDPHQPSLSTLKYLLEAGADPNDHNASTLCHAVYAANSPITDCLLECQRRPSQAALGIALPHALHISDPMDRLSFTKKLIDAGALPLEVNRALIHAIGHYTEDLLLIGTLASAADTADGEALALSVSKESIGVVDLLLTRSQQSQDARNTALGKVMSVRDRALRRNMCHRLLTTGISAEMSSNSLRIAAHDGDIELCKALMSHGAIIDAQTIIEACRGGNAELLEALLHKEGNFVHKRTLERGFQAATEVGDLNKRAVIFEKLLKRGVSGEPVDAQLLSAARYGEAGHECLRVLLEGGADPNFNQGEAVIQATRTAFLRNLELLLGLWDNDSKQKRVSAPNLIRAFKACWNLNHESRIQVVRYLIMAGMSVTDDVHIALNDAVNEKRPDEELVKLLLDHGASPTANNCKTLVDAAKNIAAPCLQMLLEQQIPQDAINRTFTQCFTAENFDTWFSKSGKSIIEMLLERGAQGIALSEMLVLVMRGYNSASPDLSDDFVELIISYGPDVNYNSGEPLQVAASSANVEWTNLLLGCHPSSETLAYAFQHIFDTPLDEDDALALFKMFTEYREGETSFDVMTQKSGSEPVLVRAMSQYPRSTKILGALLDAGYYHDQMTTYKLLPELEEAEDVTLLSWAIAQPQKKISSALIQILLERGANVNVTSSVSLTTPLMLSIQTRRLDLVKSLLLEGADVNPTDALARSALSMTSTIGGDLAIDMMGCLLAAEPNPDDGSLHNAARDLNFPAVRVLVQAGHDPDFPSTCHDGRSALAEVCFRGSDLELNTEREKSMQKVMAFLIHAGSDLTLKSREKPMLYLCFEAKDPVATTRIFLKVGMWKHINKPLNHFTDGKFTYSPTMYIIKKLYKSEHREHLLSILNANRCTDVFYANEGPQPDDAVGLPEDLKVQERERKFRLQRQAEQLQDFNATLARKRELSNVENQIWAQKAEMEDARRRKLQNDDLLAIRSRAQLEESFESAAHQRRIAEQRALTDTSVSRARAIAAAEVESEDMKQRKALEWQGAHHNQQVGNARAMAAVRLSEREEVDRLERVAEERMGRRLEAQRKVVESQERLARRIAAGPGLDSRRQIGFVESQELN